MCKQRYTISKGTKFPKLRQGITVTLHGEQRIKSRVPGMNTKKRRDTFIKNAAKGALMQSDIPQIPEFADLVSYLKRISYKIKKKNSYCQLYYFQDYIFIVSTASVLITVLNVDDIYKGRYQEVMKYLDAA